MKSADLIPPVIDNLPNVTVHCGDDSSPSTIGSPSVTDNEDLNPSLTYRDVPYLGCTLTRIWIATDSAGNTALVNQSIRFSDLLPPVVLSPSQIAVACGSIEDASSNLAHNNISLQHPCNRPISISFSDSANITQCGFTFSRVWEVEDDCGMSTVFTQVIRVLNQQFPVSPMNGLINARVDEPLFWPQFPGATSYKVYAWPEAEERANEPVVTTNDRSYYPSSNYHPGTRILWQIEYDVGINTTVPSPVWSFETVPLPDLLVTDVTVPSFAFSGQNFDVRWTVINSGNLSVTAQYFSDAIYMGHTSSFSDSRLVHVVYQRRFLDPNDGYNSDAEINIAENDIGIFYVFIFTDYGYIVSMMCSETGKLALER